MNTTTGGQPLKMEAIIATDGWERGLSRMTEKVREFSNTSESQTARVDKAIDKLGATTAKVPAQITNSTDALKQQREIIKQIERDISNVEKTLSTTAPGARKADLQAELTYAKRALDEEKASLQQLEQQVNQTGNAQESYRMKIRNLLIEMANLEQAGKRNTAEYVAMRNEAARLQDAIDDVTAQTRILANDQAGFQGVITGVAGITGAFSAAQGAMAIFGSKNEDLIKIQTRVQSLMAMTVGLQQVSNTLNKDSAFRIVYVERATRGWASAQTFLNTQLGIGAGLTKALMLSGVGLLIAGVGLLVNRLIQWRRETDQISESQQRLQEITKGTAESLAKERAAIESHMAVLRSANSTYAERHEALRRLQDIAPGFNGQLTKEGELINANTEALELYIAALERSIYIKANEERLTELFTEQYRIKEEIKAATDAYERALADFNEAPRQSIDGRTAMRGGSTGAMPTEIRIAPSDKEIIALQKQLDAVLDDIDEAKGAFEKGLLERSREIPLAVQNFNDLVIEWITRGNQEAYAEAQRRLTTENAITAYIQALQKARGELELESEQYKTIVAEIERLSPGASAAPPPKPEATRDYAQQLADMRRDYQTFYQWVEFLGEDIARDQFSELISAGDNFLQYVRNQIAALERLERDRGTLAPEQYDQLLQLRTTEAELTGRRTRLESFQDEIKTKRDGYQSLTDYIQFLQGEIDALNQKESELAIAKKGILTSELEQARREQNNIFAQLLRDTASFEQRLFDIRQAYAQERRMLNEAEWMSPEERAQRMAEIERDEKQQTEALQKEALERAGIYEELHEIMMSTSRREIKQRLDGLRAIIAAEREKAQATGLSAKHLDQLETQLQSIELSLRQMTAQGLREVAFAFRAAADTASLFDDKLQSILLNIADLTDGAAMAAEGIALLVASGGSSVDGWIKAIAGVAQTVKKVIDIFRDDSEQQRLQELLEFQRRIEEGEHRINMLYIERLRLEQQWGEARYQALIRQRQEVEQQIAEITRLIGIEMTGLLGHLNSQPLNGAGLFQWDDPTADIGAATQALDTFRQAFDEIRAGDGEGASGLWWIGEFEEVYERLEQMYEKGMLSEGMETLFLRLRELVEAGEDAGRAFEELQRQINEALTGTTAQSIAQSIAEGFAAGKRTIEDFAQDFEAMIRQAILNGFTARYLEQALEPFYQTFADMSGEGLDQDKIEQLRQMYEQIITEYGGIFDDLLELTGMTFDQDHQGLAGAIQGVTEQTAGRLEGYINAIRIQQADQLQIVNQQLSTLLVIAANTAHNRHLKEIRDLIKEGNRQNTASIRATGGL